MRKPSVRARTLSCLALFFLFLLLMSAWALSRFPSSAAPALTKPEPGLTLPCEPGSLDPSFDGDGRVTTDVLSSGDVASSVAIQPDGRIVAAGYSWNGSNDDFALVRYNADGSLDTTFDGDGRVTTPVLGSHDGAYSVAIQPDGRIVAAGYSDNGSNWDFALVRYNADGSLDTTFDGDGKVTTPVLSSHDYAYSVAIQPDGRIVAAGYSWNGSNNDFALVRYNADGSLDTTFDTDGKVTTPVLSSNDRAYSVAIQPDGRIVAAGYSDNGSNLDFALVRYNANGSLDTSFDTDGRVTTPVLSSTDGAYSVAIQPDGRIVAAGYSWNGSNDDFALVRYNANGSLDTTFDGDGRVTTPVLSSHDYAYSVAIQPDGRIVGAGYSWNGSNNDFALVRYNADGSLDTTFDTDGKVTTPVLSSDDRASSVAIQPDGRIVVAGYSHNGSNDDFALVRYGAQCATTPTPTPGPSPSPSPSPSPTPLYTRGDYDGDNKTDTTVWRPTAFAPNLSAFYTQYSGNGGFFGIQFGNTGDVAIAGDFDADNKTDFGVSRFTTADGVDLIYLESSTNTAKFPVWGNTGDIFISGDYDGDKKTDVMAWRPSDGTWYIVNSSGANGGFTFITHGQNGDKPYAMDTDGDGKANLVYFRPSSGDWVIRNNDGSSTTINFGLSTDIPVPADYDGDNKDDIAVFRDGLWIVRRSSDGQVEFTPFGTTGDIPIPGDYDADNKYDRAVYRAGIWHMLRSTQGYTGVQFGAPTDTPMPKTFIP